MMKNPAGPTSTGCSFPEAGKNFIDAILWLANEHPPRLLLLHC